MERPLSVGDTIRIWDFEHVRIVSQTYRPGQFPQYDVMDRRNHRWFARWNPSVAAFVLRRTP